MWWYTEWVFPQADGRVPGGILASATVYYDFYQFFPPRNEMPGPESQPRPSPHYHGCCSKELPSVFVSDLLFIFLPSLHFPTSLPLPLPPSCSPPFTHKYPHAKDCARQCKIEQWKKSTCSFCHRDFNFLLSVLILGYPRTSAMF